MHTYVHTHLHTCMHAYVYMPITWERARESALNASSACTDVLMSADQAARHTYIYTYTWTCMHTYTRIHVYRLERARESALNASSACTHVLMSADQATLAVTRALDTGAAAFEGYVCH